MKKVKQVLLLPVMLGLLCILPAAFHQADAAEISSDSVLVAAKGGQGHGSNSGTGPASGSQASVSGKNNPSQNQPPSPGRVEAGENAPDKGNGRQANRVVENARGALQQIREQSGDQARAGEKWQELRGRINQVKEQRKQRLITREEAKILLRDSLELAKEQQNLEEQENCLEDLVEIDPADKEAYKELGATYRMMGKQGVKVFSNGVGIKFDVPPVIKEGRTLIPVRALTEGFGATVNYDAANRTVTVTKGETTIVLTLGQNVALVNGREVLLDAKAELNHSRTIVPLRFIAETFTLNVDNPDEDIVTVNDPATDATTGTGAESHTGSATESAAPGSATEENTQNTATENSATPQ